MLLCQIKKIIQKKYDFITITTIKSIRTQPNAYYSSYIVLLLLL